MHYNQLFTDDKSFLPKVTLPALSFGFFGFLSRQKNIFFSLIVKLYLTDI